MNSMNNFNEKNEWSSLYHTNAVLFNVQCSTCIHTYHVGSHCLVRNDYGKVSLKSVNADKSFFAHAISDPKLGTE